MNGYLWHVKFVEPWSPELVDRTGETRVATTDPRKLCIFLSNDLSGNFLMTVLLHELGHCAMISFHLLDDIHRFTKREYWIEAEEWICNFIADYGFKIFKAAYSILGLNAWKVVPAELEKILA